MLRIAIVEDEIGDLVNVIRNLMALDRSRYQFEIIPVLLSDPEVDTDEAIEDCLDEQRDRLPVNGWPRIEQKGKLCPADEKDRAEILKYLTEQRVNVIVSDCWIGRDTGSESRFPDAALQRAGVMLLDSAVKEEAWKKNSWRCWMMTKYQRDVIGKLYDVGGWQSEKFDPYKYYMDKTKIIDTPPGHCDFQLERMVQEAVAHARMSEIAELPEQVASEGSFGKIIGRSAPMQKVYREILAVAGPDVIVTVLGETGTGKNLVASALHENSPRKNGPFISINTAAIPDTLLESTLFGHEKGAFTDARTQRIGIFEQANGGTIFLNEIGDMPQSIQAKILDVLDTKEVTRLGASASKPLKVDVRIVTGTHQPLGAMKEDGRFRKDLYYRISEVEIKIPALRDRREDIPLLCDYFISQYAAAFARNVKSISESALEILQNYSWPGNVRELKSFIKKAILKAGNKEVIDTDNDTILEISNSVESNNGPGNPVLPLSGEAITSFVNMPVSDIWNLIKQGRVRKKLPQWVKEIGKPRTFELIDLIMKEYHNGYPDKTEIRRLFGMNYNAWKVWVHRNKN